ncbi:dUTPase [Lottiidibacillus patelloidae]|uniref:dUTPase n=1 Tax=Lottiidibacillus patelloidae TaxID=2670334 RepID=A0A263BWI7_9BACI|nr:dUTP diphosphatase [Lottiidibacillus patelloidae]OZM57932.1 dUTPase [Lottiidibacillus patelloidae]
MLNFTELYAMQKSLDEKIEKQHGLENKKLIQERILALYVEIGELANETRCFKFWSTKPASDREKILEEYVDGLHFILSLGLTFSYEVEQLSEQQQRNDVSLTSLFNTLYETLAKFDKEKTKSNYINLFENFLIIGQKLTFSNEEIIGAYIEKNKVNIVRQRTGY